MNREDGDWARGKGSSFRTDAWHWDFSSGLSGQIPWALMKFVNISRKAEREGVCMYVKDRIRPSKTKSTYVYYYTLRGAG